MDTNATTTSSTLHNEARALGRFILGAPVDAEFVERYAAAHAHVLRVLPPSRRGDAAIVALGVKRPALLPFLAAASAVRARDGLLHKKSLLMAAILEASPRYADEFLPRSTGPVRLVLMLGWTGAITAIQVAIGWPLLWMVGRRA